MFGRNPKLIGDCIIGVNFNHACKLTVDKFLVNLKNIVRAQESSKGLYDNKFNCKLKSLKVGDFVLVRNENRWLEIPYKIISQDDKSIPVN